MKLLFRLLRKNINLWQLAGFAMANLVGAVIVLFGIQAYDDAAQVLKSPDSALDNNIMILSKPVSTLTTIAGVLGGGPRSFSEDEIRQIEDLEGVTSVGTFRTASFPVSGSISYAGFNISTEMFVESVPDEYLEINNRDWKADVDGDVLPIIIPQTYINFYNYGFAAARGTPQISAKVFDMIPITLVFRGKEGRKVYKGEIVGLTDRMNSILVPDEFLREANLRFATTELQKPTRVIVEAGSDSPQALIDFVDEEGFVIEGDSEDSVRMLAIVRTIISVVVALGLLVSSLAFFLLLISILLLIEKNRYKNDTLHQLGYPDKTIALPYQTVAVAVDVIVWIVAVVITLLLYPVITSLMQTVSPDFEPSGPWLIILSSLGMCFLFSLIHIILIRRKIRS